MGRLLTFQFLCEHPPFRFGQFRGSAACLPQPQRLWAFCLDPSLPPAEGGRGHAQITGDLGLLHISFFQQSRRIRSPPCQLFSCKLFWSPFHIYIYLQIYVIVNS